MDMHRDELTKLGKLLQQAIENSQAHDRYLASFKKGPTLHVPSVADALLFAYEQLRNASENIEDHLLIQKAITRFYKRNIIFNNSQKKLEIGKELVIELTQAQYLENDSITLDVVKQLDDLVNNYLDTYRRITVKKHNVPHQLAEQWILEMLSVKTEQLFNSHIRILSFAHIAHVHFTDNINYDKVLVADDNIPDIDRPILLYISIHKALLKSDDANVRCGLFDLYSTTIEDTAKFISFNKKYDRLAASASAVKLSRFITKNGAPLRIIRSVFLDDEHIYSACDLIDSAKTLSTVGDQIDNVYTQVRRNVNNGVGKSIVFLIITKALIGLMIEVPYDLIVTGSIIILPLAINMLFPPIFLAITALTFRLPGPINKEVLVNYIESMIYSNQKISIPTLKYSERINNSKVFNVIFFLIFLAVFYFAGTWLYKLDFNIVQGVIFIIFFSTASFLGYRLTLQIKEIEYVSVNQGFLSIVRDFIYTPFVLLGKSISYRFGRLNIIGQILDLAVDLPLKTFVKLLRQWGTFLNNKKDELL